MRVNLLQIARDQGGGKMRGGNFACTPQLRREKKEVEDEYDFH
jgi:hypothetical protein